MAIEIEPIDTGPRSIFELMILTQIPGIVDNLLNTTYDSEEEILELIESRGFRVGDGTPTEIPQELTDTLSDFDLKSHSIIDREGKTVGGIGILKGDGKKLIILNTIIEKWRSSQNNQSNNPISFFNPK